MEKDLRERIHSYLLKHPEFLSGNYQSTSEKFDVGYEQVRNIARSIREHSNLPKERKSKKQLKDGVFRVKSLDDLLRIFKIDLSCWALPYFFLERILRKDS